MTRQYAERRGRFAELVCVIVLRLTGWRILARRLTGGRGTGLGEIDIVARRRIRDPGAAPADRPQRRSLYSAPCRPDGLRHSLRCHGFDRRLAAATHYRCVAAIAPFPEMAYKNA